MNDDRLSALSILSIKRDYVQKLDFEGIIADFTSAKARKVQFWCGYWSFICLTHLFNTLLFIFRLFLSYIELLRPSTLFVIILLKRSLERETISKFATVYLGPVLSKILREETLSQLWPNACGMRLKFFEIFVSSSDVVPEFHWISNKTNKVFTKFEGVLSQNLTEETEDPHKKVFTAILYYIRPEFGIYWCWQPFFLCNRSDAFSQWRALKFHKGNTEISMGER